MIGTMYAGYVFLCNNESQKQCLRNRKYTCAGGSPVSMDDIQEGSVIFLYNSETQALLGPFTTSEHGTVLEKGAWAEDIDHHSASENVKVEWEELHLLQGATKELPFLK